VAVCYMGDGRRPVPKAALDAILTVAADADRYFGRELVRLAHRDVGATQCPGDWLYAWWQTAKVRPAPEPDPFALKPPHVPRADWRRLLDWRAGQ
jgi:hypothetical protein